MSGLMRNVGFDLDQVHLDFQASCRDFVKDKIAPLVTKSEEEGRLPAEAWRLLGDAGFLSLGVPEHEGGSDGDYLAVVIASEELARASGGIAIGPLVSAYMAAPHLRDFGTPEQCERYLPGLRTGHAIAALAVTEPEAGSDVASITTTADAGGDSFILNGRKIFITNAGIADVLIVAARTRGGARHKNLSLFIVHRDDPGLDIGAPLRKVGWRSSDTREVSLIECVIPANRLLGRLGNGFHQIMSGFQLERLVLAAMGVGLAEAAYEEAVNHCRERAAFGAKLRDFQAVRHKLSLMATQIAVARLMTYQAAARLQVDHPSARTSIAMAKLISARIANKVADEAVQLFGGMGYMDETPVAMHFRDARILRIGGGSDEIQLEILGKQLQL